MNADPRIVLDLIEGFRRSKTMFAALELGIFEGKREGKEIDRLLAACGSLGLLEKRGDGEWVNTPAADEYLRKDSPRTLSGYIEYSNMALYPMWGHLEDAVREGGHRWKQTFGFEGGIFSSFFKSDEARDRFLMGMHGFGQLSSPAVAKAFDLSRFTKLIDLGGASGHLAMAAVAAYPNLEAAVFDLPQAIEFARHFVEGTQVELITGDFFTDPLPRADLYALGRILHDWSSDKIALLLARVHDALPPGGGLLIAEKLLGPTHVSAHMQSLSMLVCTEGRERTLDEYRVLLESAGFRDIEGVITGAPLDAVLARKP
ncbi:MAG TPA: methyltransferase [Bryobacteraceae bacterium]|jgi:acetylserotonin N-methyltransferase